MKKLLQAFYEHKDVVSIAENLLGKIIVTETEGVITSARITETEAYVARVDKASHAYNGRRTNRNEYMYSAGGTVYVYICYGMHTMLNVVTNAKDVPDAILIRAAEPLEGVDIMLQRTGKKSFDNTLTKGPGNLAKALGVTKKHSGMVFGDKEIRICDDGFTLPGSAIGRSKRIGVDSAGPDALLPYRFYIRGNRFVSGRPVK
ncbi:MAG: DNA-3-methyladenine glycosylase [Ferruginibacter sp.]